MARVYDLEQFIEPSLLGCDKERIFIESVCVCHDRLIITTNESFGYCFQLEHGKPPLLITRNHLKIRKPIVKIHCIDIARAILLTSDGILCLLNVEKMELIRSKQSQLTSISDFSMNPRPSNHTRGLLECEFIISGQKKKTVALTSVTTDNKIISKKEFVLDDVPLSILCLHNSALIQTASSYSMLNLSTSHQNHLMEKDVETKAALPMTTMSSSGEYLFSGPGFLGVFIEESGIPGRPPLQLNTNIQSVVEVEEYLATTDGSFVVINGQAEGASKNDPLEQLQIIPIPGVQFIVYSESVGIQLCCTGEAVYSLTKLPFYSIAFHLLNQNQIEEALETVREAVSFPPSGMDLEVIADYSQRIRIIAGFLYIGIDAFEKADKIFEDAAIKWRDLLALFNKNYQLFGFQIETSVEYNVETNYLRRCPKEKVECFIASMSTTKISVNKDSIFICSFLWLLLDKSASQRELYTNVVEMINLELTQDTIEDIIKLLEDHNKQQEYPNVFALLKWHVHENEFAFRLWTNMTKNIIFDETFNGITDIGPLVTSRLEITESNDKLQKLVLKNLTLFLSDQHWFIKIISRMKINETLMIKRLEKYPNIKYSYLQFLVNKSTNIDEVYKELAQLYFNKKEYSILRKFISQNAEKIDHNVVLEHIETVLADKTICEDLMVLKAETLCRLGRVGEGLEHLLDNNLDSYFDDLAYENGPYGLTKGAEILMGRGHSAFNVYAVKFSVYLAPTVLNLLNDNTTIHDASALILGILRSSHYRLRESRLRAELYECEIRNQLELFREKNFKVERSKDEYSNVCKITGKEIKRDFCMYPRGYICSLEAAPSPDVCPLTGKFLSCHRPK